jgi:hypothetical protein
VQDRPTHPNDRVAIFFGVGADRDGDANYGDGDRPARAPSHENGDERVVVSGR